MPTGDEYRSRANECIAAADNVTEPERKVSLLELAQRWLRLAFQVEQIGDQKRALRAMSCLVMISRNSAVASQVPRRISSLIPEQRFRPLMISAQL